MGRGILKRVLWYIHNTCCCCLLLFVVVVVVVFEEVDGEVSKKLHWDTNHVQAVTLWLSALPLSYLNRDKEGRYYPVLELGVIPLVHLWRHEKQGTVLN